MPRYKRYFPVSHDFNHDPEILELRAKYGATAALFWLEIYCILDKTENVLKMDKHMMKKICAASGKTLAGGYAAFAHGLAKGWLEPAQPFTSGCAASYSSPNYAKYHRIREHSGNESGAKREHIRHDLPGKGREGSSLTPNSSLTSSEEEERIRKQKEKIGGQNPPLKKEKAPEKDRRTSWPKHFILTDHLRAYAERQGIKKPDHEFETFHLKAKARGYLYIDWSAAWMTWCRNELQKNPSNRQFEKPNVSDLNRATANEVLHELSPKKKPVDVTPKETK